MRRRRERRHRCSGAWPRGLALWVVLLAWALPACAENGLDVGPARRVRIDGKPERFVVCDQAGQAPVVSVMQGRRAIAVVSALSGETVTLDPGACEPPVSARPSVQCSVGRAPQVMHIDVRLADRARRAGNGIFGERWEYRSLRLRQLTGDNVVSWVDHEVELPLDEMFEDRVVRHVDQPGAPSADSCGTGFLVIRSHVRQGAALALYALSPSGLESRAVSEPLGERERWRDVIGVADVVGDGRRRIVEVAEPHRMGRLQIDDIRAGRIEPEATLDGYTTHRLGSGRQGVGALLDVTGDGVTDIVVPTSDWKCLAVVTARQGVLREVGRLSCNAALIVDVLAVDLNGDDRDDLVAVRADGTIEAWFR
ncbi:MAG TPA: VCBS repeat-containing protein [Vineibacter sp.]|nr:VCBS repeat-containing protein [Vineibacter sp.]